MEIRHFAEFLELAEIGSYTAAAQKLHISQSVLSKHMKQLEEELGTRIFVRNKNGVRLNEEGNLMLHYAHQIVTIQKNYTEELLERKRHGGRLRIASMPPLEQIGVSGCVSDFVKDNPQVFVEIQDGRIKDINHWIDGLWQQEYDLLFVRGLDERYSELKAIPYMEDRLCAIMPASHILAGQSAVTLKDIQYERLIFSAEGTDGYELLINACREAGFEPYIAYTNNNGKVRVKMVTKNLGIAIMNERATSSWVKDFQGLCQVPITPVIASTVYLYYYPDRISVWGRRFIQYLMKKEQGCYGIGVSERFCEDGRI